MDPELIWLQLEAADRRMAEARRQIAMQRRVIAHLLESGYEMGRAQTILERLEFAQALHRGARELLLQELAEIRNGRNPDRTGIRPH